MKFHDVGPKKNDNDFGKKFTRIRKRKNRQKGMPPIGQPQRGDIDCIIFPLEIYRKGCF